MQSWTTFAATCCVLMHFVAELGAQQQAIISKNPIQIEVGQPISAVQRSLQSHKIEFSNGGWQISLKEGIDYLSFVLDKNQSCALVFFSKTNQTVTSIDFVSWPQGNESKSTRSWLRSKAISIDPDGSYAVNFLRPLRDDEMPPKVKSVYPSSTNPPGQQR